MKTIAAGTYRFNDILTIPNTALSAAINFTVPAYILDFT
jgi:hypothetical protein